MGMGYVKEKVKETKRVWGEWNVGAYRWKAPAALLDEFIKALGEKRLLGSLCTECGRVYLPPREICSRCFRKIDAKTVVSNFGTLLGFLVSPPIQKGKVIIAGMDAVEMGWLKEGEEVIIGIVNFDGTSSKILLPVLNVKPKDVFVDMRVKAVFAEKPKGTLGDLLGVEPAIQVRYEG
jgi:uncharacterized OB-fold protein